MHRRSARFIVLALVVAASCSSSAEEPAASPPSSGPPATAAATGECPTGLEDALGAWGDVGFDGTVAIVRGSDSCVAAAGLRDRESRSAMTGDSVFAIGSISKSFTAAAVMTLVSDGRLSLDDRAGDVVGGLVGPVADATVEQLLTHTSGLVGDAGPDHQPLGRDEAIAAINALPHEFAPGADFAYTNAGYTLLALAVDEVTGDYRGYMADQVLPVAGEPTEAGFWDGEPAARGRRAIGYLDSGPTEVMGDFSGPHWATSGNGDLAMSTPTLAAWTAALFTGGLLPAEAVESIGTPRWDHGDGTSETLGWVRYDASLFGAAGFAAAGGGGDVGHDAIVAFVPETRTAIAVASSTPGVTAEQLLQEILDALVTGEPIPHPATGNSGGGGTHLDQATVDRVTGTYAVDGGGELAVAAEGDELVVAATGGTAVRALFSLPEAFTDEDVAAHERAVVELITGDDPAGAEEREMLDDTVGKIDDVAVQGTIADQNELRTYVTVTGGDDSLDLWYALTDDGAIAAAEGPTDAPAATFVPQRDGTFVDADPTGGRDEVTLTFGDDTVTVAHGTITVTARKAA
jgi:CubicO group peptidase (beta-lactamase class C family)